MNNETEEVAKRVPGMPDRALIKAVANTDVNCAIDWILDPEGRKLTRLTIGRKVFTGYDEKVFTAYSNTALITALINALATQLPSYPAGELT